MNTETKSTLIAFFIVIFAMTTMLLFIAEMFKLVEPKRKVKTVNYDSIRTDALKNAEMYQYIPDSANKYLEISNECWLALRNSD